MLAVVELILPVFVVIICGTLLQLLVRLPPAALGWMNYFVVYVALPAMFFNFVSRTPFEDLLRWDFISVILLVAAGSLGVSILITRLTAVSNFPEAIMAAVAATFGNFGYMGPALALAAFGPVAATPVALIVAFEAALFFCLVPLLMATAAPTGKTRDLLFTAGGRVVGNPLILATVAGGVASMAAWTPPDFLNSAISSIAGAAAPCALFALGVTVASGMKTKFPVAFVYLVPFKLIIYPFLVFTAVTHFTAVDETWAYTAALLAALPTATTAYNFAQQYACWSAPAAGAVVVTTVISAVTVPAVLIALGPAPKCLATVAGDGGSAVVANEASRLRAFVPRCELGVGR